MTKEETLWFQQEFLNGELIGKESFIKGLEHLLPGVKEDAASIWADFARERVEAEQYVRFKEEPGQIALSRWHDTLLAAFVLLSERSGRETAAKVCCLSLGGCCLYPWEMGRAAEEMEKGASLDAIAHMMREGELESDTAEFPTLKGALDFAEPAQAANLSMIF